MHRSGADSGVARQGHVQLLHAQRSTKAREMSKNICKTLRGVALTLPSRRAKWIESPVAATYDRFALRAKGEGALSTRRELLQPLPTPARYCVSGM
ncbi:hypothetical protein NDU88_005033 [Pleurodeles waltl]|uniref:Uncharacterized protein n=1 Tax=Pleurodeles waltl TaxID=8319 RepID=A0AAV7VMD7_PLEWA|nr:hypothetical protein NDU88_005033 [Pleurodeles waltl]